MCDENKQTEREIHFEHRDMCRDGDHGPWNVVSDNHYVRRMCIWCGRLETWVDHSDKRQLWIWKIDYEGDVFKEE